jgi:hypothetical protein
LEIAIIFDCFRLTRLAIIFEWRKQSKMAARFKLKEAEKKHGDLTQVIPPLVNAFGQAETARRLGVSQFTISRWLKMHGYKSIITYQKQEALPT